MLIKVIITLRTDHNLPLTNKETVEVGINVVGARGSR